MLLNGHHDSGIIVIGRIVVDVIKKYLGDIKWVISIAAVIYAICIHIYVIEGLPARVSNLEKFKESSEQYHHKIDLAIIQTQTSVANIESQITRITEWIFNGRTTH